MKPRTLLLAVGLLFGFLLCIQLVPVWLLQTDPPVVSEPPWDGPQTRALAQRACFDCHSNETVWPLYSRIAPMSWLVTWDVVRGRREMNFSEWQPGGSGERGERGGRRSDEIGQVITRGEMPPSNYLMIHPEARLSAAEKDQLIRGLQASLR